MRERAAVDEQAFRRVLGSFATGVVVITGMDGDEPVGFACQAFAAVSLAPPLVLFCVDHRGRSWPRIRPSGRFCANVLAEGQGELCRRFGSRRDHRFDGLDWAPSAWGCPALPGVLARVHGQIDTIHRSGDHDVVIGRVQHLEEVGVDLAPLVFFRGGFGLAAREPAAGAGDGWDWSSGWDWPSGWA